MFGPLISHLSHSILLYMKNDTENTKVTKSVADHGPINQPGLTAREYQEMKEAEYWERQEYLDYINER
jgi:hypothetical protein